MSAIDPAEFAGWQKSVGRQLIEMQLLTKQNLRRFALAIGLPGEEGHPPLAHWAHFLPAPADAQIGEDGHPKRGGFLPAITLPRRVFAASTMTFEAPLETAEEARLTSTVAEITHKSGRSGDLVFVEVDRELWQDGVVRVRERQSYVYRGDGGPVPMPEPSAEPLEGERWQPNEVNLFRFSAATFNGHRIHYDLPYARDIEGYPALVVHGPFTAAKLALLAQRDGDLATFSFRAQAPLFLGQPIFLRRGAAAGDYLAVRADGATAMTAKASFR